MERNMETHSFSYTCRTIDSGQATYLAAESPNEKSTAGQEPGTHSKAIQGISLHDQAFAA
jgi:hypothetical protein